MQEMIIEMLTILIQVIIVAVGGLVIGWVKEKIGEVNFDKSVKVAKTVVQSVEQEFGALIGEERKQKAIELIHQKLGGKLSVEEINTLIEAAVFEMNTLIKPKSE